MSTCDLIHLEGMEIFKILSTGEAGITVSKDALKCCNATGELVYASGILHCDLHKKLKRINAMYMNIFEHLDSDKARLLLPEKIGTTLAKTVDAVKDILAKRLASNKSSVSIKNLEAHHISLIWPVALLLSWHTDHQITILSQNELAKWHPKDSCSETLLLYGLSKLYSKDVQDDFEAFIQRAYSYGVGVIIEYTKEHAQSMDSGVKKPSFNHQGFIKEKLGFMKTKDPLSYVSESTRSKLKSMEHT